MSLDYNLKEIDDDIVFVYREISDEGEAHWQSLYDASSNHARLRDGVKELRELSPITHGLIMLTMAIGIGDWKPVNLPEVWARISMYERVKGAIMIGGADVEHPMSMEDVYAHAGLKTNVALETRAKWMRRIITADLKESSDKFSRYANEQTTTV